MVGHLKGLFYTGLVIDDVVFKLHYGFTTYLLLTMTFLLVGNVVISGQIYCTLSMYEFEKIISKEMLNSYCYIHSTFVVPNTELVKLVILCLKFSIIFHFQYLEFSKNLSTLMCQINMHAGLFGTFCNFKRERQNDLFPFEKTKCA